MKVEALAGQDLGAREVRYDERDAILFALAVGAPAGALDLVYERDLRVLPAYACALGLWGVEAAGALGAYDRRTSLHAAQRLEVHEPLPAGGRIETRARVSAVWDKGRAAMIDVEVSSSAFTAIYSIYLPGLGGWGGERGPSARRDAPGPQLTWAGRYQTSPEQAVLYRLTGDRHPVHVDPVLARANGLEGPILHGLCTLAIVAREVASAAGAHPAALRSIEARLSAPVTPGDAIDIRAGGGADELEFEARVGDTPVLTGARARFAS